MLDALRSRPAWFTTPEARSVAPIEPSFEQPPPDLFFDRSFAPRSLPVCTFSPGIAEPALVAQLEAARRPSAPRAESLFGSHKVMAGDRRLIGASITDPVRVQKFKTESKIVSEGQKYLGTPYVWGGTSKSGLDCSGFTHRAMKDAGSKVPLEWFRRQVDPRFDPRGAEGHGMKVVKDPRPGDVVVFGKSHVGIYTGNVDGVAMYMSANHGGSWATPGNSGNARVDVMPVRDHFVKPPVYFRYSP